MKKLRITTEIILSNLHS